MNPKSRRLWFLLSCLLILPAMLSSCAPPAPPAEVECTAEAYSARATAFREYRLPLEFVDLDNANADADWRFARGLDDVSLGEATEARFDAWAKKKVVFLGMDDIGFISSTGLMKFDFPPPACDSTLVWHAIVHVELPLGVIIKEEHDWIRIGMVMREQPTSTSFPQEVTYDNFQWMESILEFHTDDLDRGQQQIASLHLTGRFDVDRGVSSSVLIGPNVIAWSYGEWASIGRQDNPNDDGRFTFGGWHSDCLYGTDVGCGPVDLNITFTLWPR